MSDRGKVTVWVQVWGAFKVADGGLRCKFKNRGRDAEISSKGHWVHTYAESRYLLCKVGNIMSGLRSVVDPRRGGQWGNL